MLLHEPTCSVNQDCPDQEHVLTQKFWCWGDTNVQGVSRLVDINAGGDFLGLCDQKSSY